MKRILSICALIVAADPVGSVAQEQGGAEKIQRQLQDPLANIQAVMGDTDFLFNTGQDDPSYSISLQPLKGFPFEKQGFNLMLRGIVPILGMAPLSQRANLSEPLPSGGGTTWGLSDIQLQTFVSPRSDAAWKWGIGPVFSLKTRTDSDLAGAGWGAGPIGVLVGGITGDISTALIGGHVWGDENGFSTSMIQPMLFYNIPWAPGWEIQYNNTITYDWTASSGNEWTVPLGLGVGKTFVVGSGVGLNIIGGFYWNVVKPTGAADSMFRLSVAVVIP